jgi:hypothetical protein
MEQQKRDCEVPSRLSYHSQGRPQSPTPARGQFKNDRRSRGNRGCSAQYQHRERRAGHEVVVAPIPGNVNGMAGAGPARL